MSRLNSSFSDDGNLPAYLLGHVKLQSLHVLVPDGELLGLQPCFELYSFPIDLVFEPLVGDSSPRAEEEPHVSPVHVVPRVDSDPPLALLQLHEELHGSEASPFQKRLILLLEHCLDPCLRLLDLILCQLDLVFLADDHALRLLDVTLLLMLVHIEVLLVLKHVRVLHLSVLLHQLFLKLAEKPVVDLLECVHVLAVAGQSDALPHHGYVRQLRDRRVLAVEGTHRGLGVVGSQASVFLAEELERLTDVLGHNVLRLTYGPGRGGPPLALGLDLFLTDPAAIVVVVGLLSVAVLYLEAVNLVFASPA